MRQINTETGDANTQPDTFTRYDRLVEDSWRELNHINNDLGSLRNTGTQLV